MNGYSVKIPLSGDRFRAVYRLTMPEPEARERARAICVEQSIEFPADLVTGGDIRDHLIGRVEEFRPSGEDAFKAEISYAVEIAGPELTQLLNVLYGNISLFPGIRLERFDWPRAFDAAIKGPRFGVEGLRRLLNAPDRPLLGAVIKVLGLPPADLATVAYELALGGIDVVKDDHVMADQPLSPFRERVARCAEAVARANRETGGRCLYMPNVTASPAALIERARFAKDAGAGGLLLTPGLTGFGALQALAEDDSLDLPLLAHPAFGGSFTTRPTEGISPFALYGQIFRMAGADMADHPQKGGRFLSTDQDIAGIVEGARTPMGNLKPIFPMPGGGMTVEKVPDILRAYGRDVIMLIGGDLHRRGPSLADGVRQYRAAVQAASSPRRD